MRKIAIKFVTTGKFCPENIIMSPERVARYGSIVNAEAKAQYLASSAAICALAGDDARTFAYGENGRPQIAGGYVSPAHTGGMAVCVYADVPVGCDIEKKDRYLSEAVQKQFGTLDDWLALEACVKMTGEGIAAIRNYRRAADKMLDKDGNVVAYVRHFDHGEYRAAVCCGEEFQIFLIE